MIDLASQSEPQQQDPVPGLGMIWAEARGGAIGLKGDMPWRLPEDLQHFKNVTLGTPVLMGRRTWCSLPERFRPLPGRRNIVITRDRALRIDGAETAQSLVGALELLGATTSAAAVPAWVMGGGELYRSALPFASELVVTRIALDVQDADTFAPAIGPEWELVEGGEWLVAQSGIEYCFERYQRAGGTPRPPRSGTIGE